VYPSLQTARIPMIDAASRLEINWAIEHLPSLKQTPRQCGSGHGETAPRIAFSTPVAVRVADGGLHYEPADRAAQQTLTAEVSARSGIQP